jgi:hypothetical protein
MSTRELTQAEINSLTREDMLKLGVKAVADPRCYERLYELFTAHKDIVKRLHEVYEEDRCSHRALSTIEEMRSLNDIELVMAWTAVAAHGVEKVEFVKWVHHYVAQDVVKAFGVKTT